MTEEMQPLDFSRLSAALLAEWQRSIQVGNWIWMPPTAGPTPRPRRLVRAYREARYRLGHAWRALRGEECDQW